MVIKVLVTRHDKCIGCMSCVSVCSKLYSRDENPAKSRIMVENLSKGAFHLVVCDQECEACLRECPTKAISRSKAGILVIDSKSCVGCLACVASCPIGAMHWYPAAAVPFKCVACGACARTCPRDALELVSKEAGA